MRFWFRELAGWVLIGVGFYNFYLAIDFCQRRLTFEAWIPAVIGIFVFRGGIHLLKVALAARVCLQAQEQPPRKPSARAPLPRTAAPAGSPLPVRRT